MPATLIAEHVASVALPDPAVQVEDLSNGERAVALYASDMPARYRVSRGDLALLTFWIVQGAARLGLDELYRSAAYASGYRRLRAAGWATPEQDAAHACRFSSASRLERAERLAAVVTYRVAMTPEARERGRRTLVERACDCAGTGWAAFDMGDGTDALQACPGHNPNGHAVLGAGVTA
ncbi:hypothetical protein ACPCK3_30290 [Streptomyces griseoincarnatus]